MSDPTKGFGPSDRTIAANQHYELVEARKTIERLTANLCRCADEVRCDMRKEIQRLELRNAKLEEWYKSVCDIANKRELKIQKALAALADSEVR